MNLRKIAMLAVAFAGLLPTSAIAKTKAKVAPAPVVCDTVSVYSDAMHRAIKAVVAKPSTYNDKKSADERYPTIYILHGYGDNYKAWGRNVNLDSLATAMNAVIVTPDGQNSWYWDSPIDSTMQFETFFTRELVPYIDTNYRTIPCGKMRAITGLSMGGHGSMYLALRHPDIFGNAGSMSGGVDIRPFPDRWKMKNRLGERDANIDRWNLYAAISQIGRVKNGDLRIIVDCGVDDFFREVNRNFHKALLDAGINHDYTERPGAHNWPYWRNAIHYHMLFFRDAFRQNQAQHQTQTK